MLGMNLNIVLRELFHTDPHYQFVSLLLEVRRPFSDSVFTFPDVLAAPFGGVFFSHV